MGTIYIDRLRVFAHTGVYSEEKNNGQNFYVSAEIGLKKDSRGALTDDLAHTVNYAAVCDRIATYLTENSFNLLECLADSLAKNLLNGFEGIASIKIRIDKPEAPITHSFQSVAYACERSWHTVYLSYGSNMGDRERYTREAIDALKRDEGIRLIKESTPIVTAPYGGVEQEDFLNGCLAIQTYYEPNELLDILHEIEAKAGRERLIHWGPRTLDLDILLYDELVLHTKDLILPHIDMANREFVLKPLAEIAPYAYHPILKKTVAELYELWQKKNV